MKTLIAAAALAGLALNSPWLLESTNNNCAAVEHLVMRTATSDVKDPNPLAMALAQGVLGLSNGAAVASGAALRHPNIPPALQCLFLYYVAPGAMAQAKEAAK